MLDGIIKENVKLVIAFLGSYHEAIFSAMFNIS